MIRRQIFCNIATLGPFGYFKAPGTLATLITLPFVYLLSKTHGSVYELFLIFFMFSAWLIIRASLPFFSDCDPSEIVLDECVGCFVTFYGFSLNLGILFLGFVLFRFFDIVKCFGIQWCEKVTGASGILLDDIVAGIFAQCILRLLLIYGVLSL